MYSLVWPPEGDTQTFSAFYKKKVQNAERKEKSQQIAFRPLVGLFILFFFAISYLLRFHIVFHIHV